MAKEEEIVVEEELVVEEEIVVEEEAEEEASSIDFRDGCDVWRRHVDHLVSN